MKNVRTLASMALSGVLLATGATYAQLNIFQKAREEAPVEKQIAYFSVKGALTETPATMPPLFGGDPPQSLKGLLERFREARLDNNIAAIVVDFQYAGIGLAQIAEIHEALRKFSAVDKDVYVHADTLTTATFALSSGASHVSMVPTGLLWLTGFYGEQPYLRGMLDKIGCVPDWEQCGDFKTAAETITRTEPTPQSKEMTDWLLDGLYESVVTHIAEGRGISTQKVRKLIDGGPYSAEQALAAGLIDSVKHRQDFVSDLKAKYGDDVRFVQDYAEENPFEMPDDNFFAMFDFFMQILDPKPTVYTDPTVAIVYVEGAILTGSAEPSPFGGGAGARSTTIRKALDKAADDDSVKAVVLRVDSPGGSALASEIILDATARVAAKKPLVVSMGNVAASGGYYVACAADTIYASPSTITASIGVLGGKIVTTGMWDKLGINWDANSRGANAGMLSTASKFNDHERSKFREYLDATYDIFKAHVVHAREGKLTKDIDAMAGGRVFTGKQALELGLVDKMGGLDDAIKHAAADAGLSDYDIRVIPEAPSIFDFLRPQRDENTISLAAPQTSATFSIFSHPLVKEALPMLAGVDPLRFRAVVQALQRIQLIHDEGVIMMTASDLIVR